MRRCRTGTLTPRETQVLTLVAQGLTDQQIGQALDVTRDTVRHHVGHLLQAMNAQNRTAAAIEGLRRGLIGARSIGLKEREADGEAEA